MGVRRASPAARAAPASRPAAPRRRRMPPPNRRTCELPQPRPSSTRKRPSVSLSSGRYCRNNHNPCRGDLAVTECAATLQARSRGLRRRGRLPTCLQQIQQVPTLASWPSSSLSISTPSRVSIRKTRLTMSRESRFRPCRRSVESSRSGHFSPVSCSTSSIKTCPAHCDPSPSSSCLREDISVHGPADGRAMSFVPSARRPGSPPAAILPPAPGSIPDHDCRVAAARRSARPTRRSSC